MFGILYILVRYRKFKAVQEPGEHQWDVWLPVYVANIAPRKSCDEPHHVSFPCRCIVTHLPQMHEFVEPQLVSEAALFRGKWNWKKPLQHLYCGAYCVGVKWAQLWSEHVQHLLRGWCREIAGTQFIMTSVYLDPWVKWPSVQLPLLVWGNLYLMGLAMTQAVSCQPLTTEPSPCGICRGQSGNRAGFTPSTTALLC